VRQTIARSFQFGTHGLAMLVLVNGATGLYGVSAANAQSQTRNPLGSGVPAAEIPAPGYESASQPAEVIHQPMEDYSSSDMNYAAQSVEQWTNQADEWCGPNGDRAENQWMDSRCLSADPPVYSSGSWVWPGTWYTRQQVVVFQILQPNRALLAEVDPSALGAVLANMNNDSDKEGFAPGARLTIGHMIGRDPANRDHALEFTFLGLFEWSAHADIGATVDSNGVTQLVETVLGGTTLIQNGGNNFFPNNPVPGFMGSTTQTVDTSSDLNSFEMNMRVNTRPGRDQMALQPNGVWVRHANSSTVRSVLAGLRVMSANDTIVYRAFDAANAQTGKYLVNAYNDLFGLQMGFDLQHTQDEFNFGFRTKVGGLYNYADRQSAVTPTPTAFVNPTQRVIDEHVSFLIEIGLSGQYKFRPNLGLKMGYDLLFISNLARAAENLGLAGAFPGLNHNGNGFYHGVSAGFEAFW